VQRSVEEPKELTNQSQPTSPIVKPANPPAIPSQIENPQDNKDGRVAEGPPVPVKPHTSDLSRK